MVERTRLLGLAMPANAPERTQQHPLDDDVFGELRAARRLEPGGATWARVEAVAPQPAGGGVAHDAWVGQPAARRATTLDDGHPMVPAMYEEIRPATVIIPCSLELLYGLSPVGLPHVRPVAVRASLCWIEIRRARCEPCPEFRTA